MIWAVFTYCIIGIFIVNYLSKYCPKFYGQLVDHDPESKKEYVSSLFLVYLFYPLIIPMKLYENFFNAS